MKYPVNIFCDNQIYLQFPNSIMKSIIHSQNLIEDKNTNVNIDLLFSLEIHIPCIYNAKIKVMSAINCVCQPRLQ